MAEGIAFSIGEYLIPKLMSIDANEIGLLYNCRDDLKKLAHTLSSIKDVILDAEELQEKSHFVRNRIKTLGEVLLDADDLLDEVTTEDLRRTSDTRGKMARQVFDFFSSSNHLFFRHKIGHAVNEIRDRLDLIANDISKFNFISTRVIVNTQIRGNRKRETDSFVVEPDVIGREKEKNKIIQRLIGSGSNTDSIIPIVGIGGLGKTALAQLVFNDERVVKHFQPMSWVCVSEDFKLELIVRNILKSITDDKKELEEIDGMRMEQLQSSLKNKLEGKRYLLVLDDVWNDDRESWKTLERRLMIEASGCKIVVTTRSVKVASAMGIDTPYELKGLSDEESLKLFERLAFGKGVKKVDQEIIEIGKELIKRCKGVPLAIKTLGSTMWSKTSLSEWTSIKDNDIWSSSPDDGDILSVLKLSYDQLPAHLKNCFAYCSIFPKDYKIEYEVLIQLWMAQGYILQTSSSSNKSLESIGDQYFKDLLSISFFQEAEFDEYRNITSVKMHDLIHDLAIQLVRTNYERVRHVSVQCDLKDLSRILLEEKGTRSFFLPNASWSEENDLKIGYFNHGTIISNFRCLRVLDLKYCGIKKLRGSIDLLKHLRYLDLSGNSNMERLPNKINNLLNLQTLNLSECYSLKKLPRGITKLSNLRCLMTDECDGLTHMPAKMGKLTSLQKLPLFVVGLKKKKKWWGGLSKQKCGLLSDLKDLNDLRGGLRIKNLERIGVEDAAEESKEANIMKPKTYLLSLILDWEYDPRTTEREQQEAAVWEYDPSTTEREQQEAAEWEYDPRTTEREQQQAAELVLENLQPHSDLKELYIYGYPGVRFPSWMRTMGNVVKLSFWRCNNCKQLQSLDRLPCLKFLSLDNLKELEYIKEEEEGGVYDDDNNNNQQEVTVTVTDGGQQPSSSSSAFFSFFPSLQELQLRGLPKLKEWWRRGEEETYTSSSSSEFPQLTKLVIDNCPMLTSMPLHPNLEELKLDYVNGNLVRERFTTALNDLPKLKSLYIWDLNDLEAMPPKWLQNLTSLESLTMSSKRDDGLTTGKMPRLPPSLQKLHIRFSPILAERCKKNTGEDWPKIAHIPNIKIDRHVIQGRDVWKY